MEGLQGIEKWNCVWRKLPIYDSWHGTLASFATVPKVILQHGAKDLSCEVRCSMGKAEWRVSFSKIHENYAPQLNSHLRDHWCTHPWVNLLHRIYQTSERRLRPKFKKFENCKAFLRLRNGFQHRTEQGLNNRMHEWFVSDTFRKNAGAHLPETNMNPSVCYGMESKLGLDCLYNLPEAPIAQLHEWQVAG